MTPAIVAMASRLRRTLVLMFCMAVSIQTSLLLTNKQ